MLNEFETLVVLEALAQETRLRIVRALVSAFPKGVSAGQLARGVGKTPATLTFHLRLLEQAGLVHWRREARQVIYCAVPERLTGLAEGLMQGCCGGRPEFCNPSYPEAEFVGDPPSCCGAS